MKKLENLVNDYRARARMYELEATREDRVMWYAHPCTQILLNALYADTLDHMLLWLGTGYIKESAEATQAANSFAAGKAWAIEDIVTKIEELRSASEEEISDRADGAQSSD